MLPSIWSENLFDELMDFDNFFGRRNPLYGKQPKDLMKTDVKENDTCYDVAIDLPGFGKDEVTAELKNGYLTIRAAKNVNNDEKDEDGRYIRRERFSNQCSRSFYVGTGITQEDIKAKLEDGILRLTVPKKSPEEIKENHQILIEG